MKAKYSIPSSFRDPSGTVFCHEGLIYRKVNLQYKENYDFLMNSGLYKALLDARLLISHEEVDIESRRSNEVYKIIKPESIPFISYPYEWSYSQLKDAALTTLRIQKKSLEFGMSLKDASAYNIQFKDGKTIFIDTLSFERLPEGQPWIAYRQFCQHFLAPLALMRYRDVRLNQLLRIYIDGIHLDLTSLLLPLHTRLKLSLLSHIHFHAKSQKHFSDKTINLRNYKINRLSLLAFIDSLESAINGLRLISQDTEWASYYEDTNYSPEAFKNKKQIVAEFLDRIKPDNVWDIGANIGIFSRIASDNGIQTISFDMDPIAVEKNYLQCLKKGERNILPLVLDLTNPSPGIGWENQERMSLLERGPTDMVFALALIHHLAISNNLPLSQIAEFLSRICNSLIIEFIPKSDSQLKKLLSTREDIFPHYTQQDFELEFRNYFTIQTSANIKDSQRTLYLMTKINK